MNKLELTTIFIADNKISYLPVIPFLIIGLVACDLEQEGPSEEIGEEIDETVQQLETDIKDTKQKAEEDTEEILNDAERAAEDAAD